MNKNNAIEQGDTPKLSFIIATVDRDKELQKCIIAVEKAYEYVKDVDIEILVVFQDRKENKTIKTNYPELFTFYFLDKRGLSLARNFGIKKSLGEYLVFLDDDTIIQEDFLGVLLKNILITKASAFCCRDTDPVKKRLYSGDFLKNKPKYLNHFKFVYFLGYAHVVKKSSIEEIGFYDEKFGIGAKYGGAEESDIFFRLKHRGEKVVYLAELVVYHPIGNITSELKRFNYYYATGAMLIKQMFLDKKHLYIYLLIISEIIFKSSIRTLQTIFFYKSIEAKNLIFRPRSVLKGMLRGIWDYLRGIN
jgi:GT2 family glycosyltransferase